ncbi:sensor histidine kinase [Sedimentitalea sp. JM2-8]|uniref:histidine kinase n=1 Tax=Sedimentitalea xiamensis TaxID=3050037 RepID=A0ABT7FJ05_9RHOB|nr:sensor histidine kinase [Sedimentitalea xiamensis]MDK3074975.1 sensor histidine kinase [Sedimentitalea xiamensis]
MPPLIISGLTLRLVFVLSLAVLPLGLVSVYQYRHILRESQALSEASLMDRTRQAGARARALIERSSGVAEALAEVISTLRKGHGNCDDPLRLLVESNAEFSFAGYIDAEGALLCASDGSRDRIADTDLFRQLNLSGGRDLHTGPNPAADGTTVFSITVPVVHGEGHGFILIAIPVEEANELLAVPGQDVDLVLFEPGGNILATEQFSETRRNVLPAGRPLADLAMPVGYTFRGKNHYGASRDFAVVPILEGRVYVLGSWPTVDNSYAALAWRNLGPYFPALIWLISVAVAAVGLHRMVIRHINRLRQWMRLYSDHRIDFENARLDRAPEELEAFADTFRRMTRRIAEQERLREEDLAEKTMLLREVHHRVKNNLQVISSIMNMQARSARHAETKRVIGQLQDRVMALASIHRQLYLSNKLSAIRADELLKDIVSNLVAIGNVDGRGNQVMVSTHFDPVVIVPEQSMPLSLLLTEAVTNAVKYCDAPEGEDCWIDVALHSHEDGRIFMSVVNSCANKEEDTLESGETGLGISLIETFATQLDATLEHGRKDDRYELHVTFLLAQVGDDPGA